MLLLREEWGVLGSSVALLDDNFEPASLLDEGARRTEAQLAAGLHGIAKGDLRVGLAFISPLGQDAKIGHSACGTNYGRKTKTRFVTTSQQSHARSAHSSKFNSDCGIYGNYLI